MSEKFLEISLLAIVILGIVAITGMVLYAFYLSDKNNRISMKTDLEKKELSFEIESEKCIKKDEPVTETDSSNKM